MTQNKPSAERMIKGGSLVLISGLLGGVFGWLLGVIASRSDIGLGAAGYGIWSMANSVIITVSCISGGFHQSFAKKISESLVTSKELAQKYARSGFIITQIFGFVFFIPLSIFSIYFFINQDFMMGSIIITIAITLYFYFLRDNFIGQLGGIQRFDYIAIVNLSMMFGGVVLGFIIIFLIPRPDSSIYFLITIFAGPIGQIFAELYLLKKVLPFSLKSSIFGEKDRKITFDALKYGLFCAIPMIILNGSIFFLQTTFYSLYFRPAVNIPALQTIFSSIFPESSFIGVSAIIIGYASVMNATAVIAWPQVPALSEAKALNDQKLIDSCVKECFKTGFNLASFFLIIYVGLAFPILYLIHGSEYVIGYIPFIIMSVAVLFTGLDFLIGSVLMGLGEGKKAAVAIGTLLVAQFALIPFFIYLFGRNNALYAGPVSLLLTAAMVFILTFRFLTKYTRNPRSTFLSVLAKGSFSAILAIIISFLIEIFIFPYNTLLRFLIGAVILGGIYLFTMLFLAGYDENDFKLLESFGPMKFFIKFARSITKRSPFYKKQEEINK